MERGAGGWHLPGDDRVRSFPGAGTVEMNPRVARPADASGHNFFFPMIISSAASRIIRPICPFRKFTDHLRPM